MAVVTNNLGTVAIVGGSVVSVTLNPKFKYQVRHTGVDALGVDDANSALTAFLGDTAGLAADLSEEDGKYALLDGQTAEIGPGIATLYVDSAAGADGVLVFSRINPQTTAW